MVRPAPIWGVFVRVRAASGRENARNVGMVSRLPVKATRSAQEGPLQCTMVPKPTMKLFVQGQIVDDILEQYSLDKLDAFLVPAVEQHVLACPVCRTRLTAIE
jgi:hypothetical protein